MNAVEPLAVARQASQSWTLLCVDDEPNILNSLQRLLRPRGYRVLTARSAAEGLEVLAGEAVDLVVSDMRMPEMTGAQFLERVRARWPDTVRILLTGYADIASTVAAINKGEIYRYIAKPWEENDVLLLVAGALERKELEREKRRLEELTLRQNEELRALNASLEERVRERTAALGDALHSLEEAHATLRGSFLNSLQVLSSLIEMRDASTAGHSRRVADLAHRVAGQLGLPRAQAQDVLFAGLLHEIGTIGLPDRVLWRPLGELSPEDYELAVKHPQRAWCILMAMEDLRGAAPLIRHHQERLDGSGYPEGLRGEAIPLGARVLAVANDFDTLQLGRHGKPGMTAEHAENLILKGRGKRYDAGVVDAFLAVVGRNAQSKAARRELLLGPDQLKPRLVLSRDLRTADGVLLLAKDHVLDAKLIETIRQFEEMEKRPLRIGVWIEQ